MSENSYEKVNQDKYNKDSLAIDKALVKLSKLDKKPTAEALAKLSGVARKTLYNRKYPIEKLAELQEAWKDKNKTKEIKKSDIIPISAEERLQNSFKQNAELMCTIHKLENSLESAHTQLKIKDNIIESLKKQLNEAQKNETKNIIIEKENKIITIKHK